MKILGIDPGFGKLGYAVIESGRNEMNETQVIDCGCIETNSRDDYEKRLILIADRIKKMTSRYRPKAIALEKVFFAKNQKTAMQVAEVCGVLKYLASLFNIPVYEYTPLEIKVALTGYGKAEKNQIRKTLQMLLKTPLPKSDDACDALAISLICAVSLKKQVLIH